MQVITVLALLFAIVFGLVAFGAMVDLHTSVAAMTTGNVAALTALLPTFWGILVGVVAIGVVIVAVSLITR
jgi:hypothetical protein